MGPAHSSAVRNAFGYGAGSVGRTHRGDPSLANASLPAPAPGSRPVNDTVRRVQQPAPGVPDSPARSGASATPAMSNSIGTFGQIQRRCQRKISSARDAAPASGARPAAPARTGGCSRAPCPPQVSSPPARAHFLQLSLAAEEPVR